MFKKLLLCAVLGFSFQSLLPIKIQTGDGVEFPLTPFQKETLNSVAINNAPAGFADGDTRRFDFLDQDTFKLLLELIGPGDVFNVDRAKEILCGTSPAEFLPLLMGCSYLMVRNAALLEIIAEHYFAIQRDISWYDFVEHAQYITAFFQPNCVKTLLAQAATPYTCLQTLKGHKSSVVSIAFSSDGKTLATGSCDNKVKLWRLTDGQCFQTFKGHKDSVVSVAFLPGCHTLATGSADETVRLWQLTGDRDQKLTGHALDVWAVAFSPDGQALASGSDDKTIKLWRLVDGRYQCVQTLEGHMGGVYSVTFSPDGQTLASGSGDNTIKLWRLNKTNGQYECFQTLTDHSLTVYSVTFSLDGQTLASGSGDKTIKLWRLNKANGQYECFQTLTDHSLTVYSVAFSPDGILASGSVDGTAKLWQSTDGKYQCIQTLKGHTESVCSVAFSPDGQTLATGSHDDTVKLCIQIFTGQTEGVSSVAFSPDGTKLATGSHDDTVKLWWAVNLNESQQLLLLWAPQNLGKFRRGESQFLDEIYDSLPELLKRKIIGT